MEELKTTDIRKSYARDFFVKPITQQYSLNMTGGIPSNAYNLGIGYTSSRSENNSKDDKINVIVGNTFRPISKLRVDVNLMFTNAKGRSGMPAYDNFTYSGKQVPYGRFRDEEGNPLAFYGSYRQEFIQSYMTEYLLDWRNIPVEDYKYSKGSTALTEFYPTVNLSYQIFPFWDVNLAGQYQHQSVENINIDDLESYAARSMINMFTVVDQNTGNVEHNVPLGGIKKSIKNEVSSYTFRFHNNLDKRWGEQRLLGVVGAEIRENLNQGESYTVYGYSELPLQTIPVDYTESFPTLPGNASQKISGDPRYTQKRNRFVSLYSNLSYMMYERYGVSASVRRDGANVFGASTNDKWTPLWSTGLFWNVSDESFFNNNLLSKLKVRATYGVSGNVDLRKTPLPIAGSISSMYTNLPALLVSDLNDPSLRWEKVATLNLGIDFNTKSGRIYANIDYYRKNGTDLYGLDLYDYTVWGLQGTIIRNAGAMRGTGMDITVNTKNIVGQFNWNTTILFSTNKNKTTKYYNREYEGINSFLSGGSIITPIVGMPLNSLAAYKWGGLDNDGNPMGYLNGELSTDYNAIRNQQQVLDNDANNIIFLGSSKPQVFGSIINDFTYKNWELSFNISFKGGYYFRKPTTSYTNLFARGTAFPDFEDRWKQAGDEEDTNVPSMLYPSISNRDNFYAMSEINVYRGGHVRLEYINLSYTLPLRFKQQFRSLVLYSNINNPGLLWTENKKRLDPEFPYRMSPRRVISFGLKTNF